MGQLAFKPFISLLAYLLFVVVTVSYFVTSAGYVYMPTEYFHNIPNLQMPTTPTILNPYGPVQPLVDFFNTIGALTLFALPEEIMPWWVNLFFWQIELWSFIIMCIYGFIP